jgi:hypothetical protein
MRSAVSKFRSDSGPTEASRKKTVAEIRPRRHCYKSVAVLTVVLAAFILLQLALSLRTAIQIGADEGFELAKATLCLKGYKLYTEVWNDQPPLHTFLITQILKHVSPSILGPRLATSVFTAVLLTAIFFICLRISGLLVAALTSALLIASPGFVELSSSCMLEIPALAPAVAALCLLLTFNRTKWPIAEVLAGILFGLAFQIKLISAILLPLAILMIWLQHHASASPVKIISRSLLVLAASLAFSFVATDYLIEGGSYLRHFQQSWSSHFAATRSFEYGSSNDHPFDWSVPLKNWDATIPAILGIIFSLQQIRKTSSAILPLAWLALSLIIFGSHKPWWAYYYIHNAIPLCWCAAIGVGAVCQWIRLRGNLTTYLLVGVFGICAAAWMGARVYLQVASIRNSPQTYSSLVLQQIERLKPFARFIYTEEPIYSFHAGIPMPPQLAVVPLKRLWSGDMTNTRIGAEMAQVKPEIILLRSNSTDTTLNDLIAAEYRPIYEDGKHRLYARKSVAKQAGY